MDNSWIIYDNSCSYTNARSAKYLTNGLVAGGRGAPCVKKRYCGAKIAPIPVVYNILQ